MFSFVSLLDTVADTCKRLADTRKRQNKSNSKTLQEKNATITKMTGAHAMQTAGFPAGGHSQSKLLILQLQQFY